MDRTPEGLRIVDDMVELPRNPVDEKIDRLSKAGLAYLLGLYQRDCYNGVDETVHAGSVMASWAVELAKHGLLEMGLTDARGYFSTTLSFDGWFGAERVACGIYARHKEIEEARNARDDAMESHPLYGLF